MEHTTDTAGYTELLFAMFDLLGLEFSPRIKDLGGQRLYRADRDSEYISISNLYSLVRLKPIKFSLNEMICCGWLVGNGFVVSQSVKIFSPAERFSQFVC